MAVASGVSVSVQCRRTTAARAQAPFVAAKRMASVSSISAAASLQSAAPARAVRCRAAAALSVRSEISCERRPAACCWWALPEVACSGSGKQHSHAIFSRPPRPPCRPTPPRPQM